MTDPQGDSPAPDSAPAPAPLPAPDSAPAAAPLHSPDSTPATDAGTLAVTVGLPWTLGITLTPTVSIDGTRTTNTAGRNLYAVPAGRHTVNCSVTSRGASFGGSELAVDVAAGRTTEVYYAAPMSGRDPGRIGLTPQEPYQGGIPRGALLGVAAFLVLFVIWVVIAGFLALGR